MTLRLAGPLLLVGVGKMGGALLEGWLRQGLDPAQIFISDPAPSADVAALLARHRIDASRLPPRPSTIVIAVKPQIVDETLKALAVRGRQEHRRAVDRRRTDARLTRQAFAETAPRSCGRCRTSQPPSAAA